MQKRPPADRWISVSEAARRLGRARPTVYRMLADRELRSKRVGGQPYVHVEDVERLSPPPEDTDR